MVIDSNVKIAVTCEKCGRISVDQLSLFEIYRDKEKRLSCSCGSLNCIIYYNELKNISLKVNCVDCGEEHIYIYKLKELLLGTEIICPELETVISIVGDRKEISEYIKTTEKDIFEVLYDKKFELFFNNHNIMKKSLGKLQLLKEDSRINCDCGNEDITTQIYSDRIELRCTWCEGVRVIYAENHEDFECFYEESSIDMKKFEFEFINEVKNSDNK